MEPVLIISHDIVGPRMAGPGIRYWALARELARHLPTTLAVPIGSEIPAEGLPDGMTWVVYNRWTWADIEEAAKHSSSIVAQGDSLMEFPALQSFDRPIVMDGYDPHVAENLLWTQGSASMEERFEAFNNRAFIMGMQCLTADFVVCASDTQRAWWLGQLEAYGRVNPYTFAEDHSLRRLVDLTPFGLPANPLPEGPTDLPGVEPGDKVVLWGGGLWEWLDPISAIRAMPAILARRPEVKLLFPGTRHPNPFVPMMKKAEEARQLAHSLRLEGKQVLFGDWVPQERWPDYLRRADIGLSLHPESIETTLAFRSRLLDYIWAGLPMVVTGGDETSRLVADANVGRVMGYYDAEAISTAILELLETPKASFKPGFDQLRAQFTWERAARPLVAFCQNPRIAPDKVALGSRLGSSFYQTEYARLRELVDGYERGRFMQLMRRVQMMRQRFAGRKS